MANALVSNLEKSVAQAQTNGRAGGAGGNLDYSANRGTWPGANQGPALKKMTVKTPGILKTQKSMVGQPLRSDSKMNAAGGTPTPSQMKLLQKSGFTYKNGTVYGPKNEPYNSLGQPGKGLLS